LKTPPFGQPSSTYLTVRGFFVTLGLRREQFVACTRSVARGHVRREKGKAEVVGDNKAFEVSDRSTLTSLDELKLLAG
jgi:hypothetical protein